MNTNDFYNDKNLFFEWHQTVRDESTRAECRRCVSELVSEMNWRTQLRVELMGSELSCVPELSDCTDPLRTYSIPMNLHDTYLPEGETKDTPDTRWIRVYDLHRYVEYAIPHRAICNFYSIGWPRMGWDPGRYVDEPWRLLLPIKRFVEGNADYEEAVRGSGFRKCEYNDTHRFFRFLYDVLYPLLLALPYESEAETEWKKHLSALVDEAISINKDELTKAYLDPVIPWVGVSERDFDLERFHSAEIFRNPFLKHYQFLYRHVRDRTKYDAFLHRIDGKGKYDLD